MNPKSTDDRKYVGYLGECIAQLELAREGLKIIEQVKEWFSTLLPVTEPR